MAGNYKPSDSILISSKKELTKVRYLSDLNHYVSTGFGAWKGAFDGTSNGLYMGGHDLKVEFLTNVNIYGISNGDGYSSYNSNCNIYDENRVSLNSQYKVYNNYLGASWKLMFKNVPKGVYLLGTDLAWNDKNTLISELFFEYVPSNILLKENEKIYTISEGKYNTTNKSYDEIIINEEDNISDIFKNNSFILDDLFKDITIGDETFKPIDKFNNFKLISDNDIIYTINGIKKNKQLVVACKSFVTKIAENIDNFKVYLNTNNLSYIKMALSIDNGVTWKTTSDNGLSWIDLDCHIPLKEYKNLSEEELEQWNKSLNEIDINGFNSLAIETINFNSIQSETIMFAYVLYQDEYESTCDNLSLEWKFDSKGEMQKMKDNEIDVSLLEDKVIITPLIDNDMMKINILNGILNTGTGSDNNEYVTDEDIDNLLGGEW